MKFAQVRRFSLCYEYRNFIAIYNAEGLNDRDIEAHRASITTELHFLYTAETTNIEELFSPDDKHQMGLGIISNVSS